MSVPPGTYVILPPDVHALKLTPDDPDHAICANSEWLHADELKRMSLCCGYLSVVLVEVHQSYKHACAGPVHNLVCKHFGFEYHGSQTLSHTMQSATGVRSVHHALRYVFRAIVHCGVAAVTS